VNCPPKVAQKLARHSTITLTGTRILGWTTWLPDSSGYRRWRVEVQWRRQPRLPTSRSQMLGEPRGSPPPHLVG
jgi:hypothetical protein